MLIPVLLFIVFWFDSSLAYTEDVIPMTLGDTRLQLIRWSPGSSCDVHSPYRMLNLHQNENASVVAAKAFLLSVREGSSLSY
jgi:hypothetical protein